MKTTKITKKEIVKSMRVYRGKGFNPSYRFCFDFENFYFEKSFNYNFATIINRKESNNSIAELSCNSKSDFIQNVYDFVNSHK